MPNTGDFDPAKAVDFDRDKAIRQQRAAEEARKQREEAEKQRRQAQEELRRANTLKLLRYADKQLEGIRNPIVSEFVVTEMWQSEVGIFFRKYTTQKRETCYYGLWLSLGNTRGVGTYDNRRHGLVKLRQPRAGYAHVNVGNDWDPRNVGNILDVDPRDRHQIIGNELRGLGLGGWAWADGSLRLFASLEEANEHVIYPVEGLTAAVRRALNFVATGQPPEPTYIHQEDGYD